MDERERVVQALVLAYCTALGVDCVDRTACASDLEVSSLGTLQIISSLRETFGVRLKPRDLERNTILELADLVLTRRSS